MATGRRVPAGGWKKEQVGRVRRKGKCRSLSTAQGIEVVFEVGRKQK